MIGARRIAADVRSGARSARDVLEDHLDVISGREPGELRDVFDVGASDPFGHRREATCTGRGG